VIKDGKQVEIPDYWLKHGNPWEIERPDVMYPVRFGGYIRKYVENGIERAEWLGGE
jgi:starch phosphorylase